MNENQNMGMTPYEQFMVAEKTSKHRTSGVAVAGLVLGCVGTALAAGVGVFVPMYANAKAKAAQDVAEAKNAGTAALLNQLAQQFAVEHTDRVQGDINLTATINDTVSGQQSGNLTATQQAQLDAYQQMMIGLGTGEYTKCPKKVELYSPAQPFQCGCGQ